MATISATGSNGHHTITMAVTQESQNQATNTSTVSYSIVLAPASPYMYTWNYETNPFVCTYTINGEIRTCTLLTYTGGTVSLASGTQEVLHNEDGKKSISFSFSVTSVDDPNLIGSCDGSGSLALTNITRISSFTVNTSAPYILGSTSISVTVSKPNSSYGSQLRLQAGNTTVTVQDTTSATQISFIPPLSLATENTTGTSLLANLTLITYQSSSGGTVLGSCSEQITLTIPNTPPTFTLSVSDVSDYNGGYSFEYITGYYLKNKSIMKTVMSDIVLANGATIKSGSITIRKDDSSGDIIAQGTARTLQWNVNWVGTIYIVGTITDSRGLTGTQEEYIYLISDYADPVPSLKIGRYTDSAGTTQDDGGEYCKITYSGTFTQIGGSHNYGRITVKYKLHSASTWTIPIDRSSTLSGDYIFYADQNQTYDVSVEIYDTLYGRTKTSLLATAISLMDWRGDGTAISFGGVNTRSNALESFWPIYEQGTSLVNKYNSKITKITDSSGSTSVASGSYVQCSSKAITNAGYYMVVGYQDWTSGFTGTTTFRIVQKRGTTSQSTWAWRHEATGGGGISGVALLQIAANDTINTEVYQSSGSNKTARTYIYAFRLMD